MLGILIRRKKEEGRRKKEEGRKKKEEGRKKKSYKIIFSSSCIKLSLLFLRVISAFAVKSLRYNRN
ncbi:MAG: hypothetical protein EAZ78_12855 [Oscillatoriales cyanobacterium]|nr:MAG: hypothetical protein EAZ96_16850 [Oscillatoriales cyanobacterium]TAE03057.1 MAG: hypothetical protein EAZ98_00705 [Oscillatoriales cyanobacterium]TAF03296.1 MAG: hypothetical protein EAZ78_12855 [Oscillatoriales cyanobacterium]TAF43544.1 MAG: hypothetical protein EAZ68_07750 [Oscillatoriales cyanobacterium]TAF71354.1 MAG: hypothetical protein EAZ59_01280 [Oscillatoriales cyanobacterium]